MISCLYCVHNEEDFIKTSLELVLPYVEEIIFVNNGSTDKTREIVENLKNPKIKIYDYPYNEPIDMGAVRTFSLEKATGDFFWQIDADEWYPKESCEAIVSACEAPGEAISFRVPYYNLSWRYGWKQADFQHYPDRIYKREVVEKYAGVLPIDMTIVKEEFRTVKHKGKGIEGVLEYDNPQDTSQFSLKQPLLDTPFYHLARTRGYNFELQKWAKYHKNIGGITEKEAEDKARSTHWVNGVYLIEPLEIPFEIPPIKKPKVSVIIPNYNYQQFVGMAIQSVLEQTYPAYEIIVVDDGSTDRSIQEILKYPVKLIKKPNQGVALARNDGANASTGDYLIFLDADDEISSDFIEKTLKEMQGDIQVVYTDIQFIGESNGIGEQPEPEMMKQWQVVPSTCALIDRRAWELSGGFKADEIFEDWGFWNRVYDRGYNFKHIHEPLIRYRKHGKSRIDYLDANMIAGYAQLKDRYNITREVDFNRVEEAKKICG
jgi:glycosyltransferase involved in cell wall biosynthesis